MKTKTKTIICYLCEHFHNEEPLSVRKFVWYNHLCKASPLPIEMNPVTGEMQARSTNDLGTTIYTDRNFKFCRDVNNGDCEFFVEKEKV